MKTIGFGGTFYTLWDVQSSKVDIADGAYYNMVTATYYKNLSKDLNEAKLKAGTDNFDQCLQGKKRSFTYKTPIILEPKLITECGRLWRIICVNDKENMVDGVREAAFEQAKKLGYLTECIDKEEGIYYQWNGPLRYNDNIWSSTIGVLFKGTV